MKVTEDEEVVNDVQDEAFIAAPEAFSFSAAGWLKMYYFGVALALIDAQLQRQAHFAGASAGSLVAAAAVLELNFLEIRDFALKCVQRCHGSLTQGFRCHKFVEEIIDSTVSQHPDVVSQLNGGRLAVSVTTLPWIKHKVYTEFESVEKLKQVLLASCCMTPIAGFPFKLDGEWVFDGGLSCFQPLVQGKKNVTVSPFYFSRADIKPSKYLPVWWAIYPPRVEDFEWVFDLGYNDAHEWIERQLVGQSQQNNMIRLSRRELRQTWPYHHSGEEKSFARFFGYRSVLKVIPSTFFDIFLLALVFFVIEPCVYALIFLELAAHGWIQKWKEWGCSFINMEASAMRARARSSWCFEKLSNPRLFLKMIPGVGKLVPFDFEKLDDVSTVFRFTMHILSP